VAVSIKGENLRTELITDYRLPIPDYRMHARSLMLVGARHLEWRENVLASPGEGELLLKTLTGAVSVGSELGQYRTVKPDYPLMTGYEAVASVVSPGPNTSTSVGARVVALFGHRTCAVVLERAVVRVPEDIPDELALLLILGCDTAAAIAEVEPRQGEEILIAGAGAIGLLTLFNLRARGFDRVDVVDPRPERLDLARRFGARRAVAPASIGELRGVYSVAFECSDSACAFEMLQDFVEGEGRICIVSDGYGEPFVLGRSFREKRLRVFGATDRGGYREYAEWFFPRLREGWAEKLALLFEREVDSIDLADAFAELDRSSSPPLKVRVRY
jgi:alcohol dehydrogenase